MFNMNAMIMMTMKLALLSKQVFSQNGRIVVYLGFPIPLKEMR